MNLDMRRVENVVQACDRGWRHLERGLALQAGMHQDVSFPGHGEVEDGQRQGAVARRAQAPHVLTSAHRVDDHCPILMGEGRGKRNVIIVFWAFLYPIEENRTA